MLDLYKLQIFRIVVQEESFSGAAERLFITQSAVSQHIKELEASLGKMLFTRGRRGVQLTSDGETLFRYAKDIFALVAEAENALTDVQQIPSGKVSIGATPGIAMYLAPDWIQQFTVSFPNLTVALNTGITSQIVAGILAQRLDIGFIEGELQRFEQPRLAWLELQEIEQLVVVGNQHPWCGERLKPLQALHQQPMIVRPPDSQTRIWLDAALNHHGIKPHMTIECDNLESIKRTLSSGTSLSVLPGYAVQSEVQQGLLHIIRLENTPLRRTLKIIWDKEIHFSPVTRAFLNELQILYPVLTSIL